MKEVIKQTIKEKAEYLPALSIFWELEGEIEGQVIHEGQYTLNAISSKHNSTEYIVHTFYKPISTTIDLNLYE